MKNSGWWRDAFGPSLKTNKLKSLSVCVSYDRPVCPSLM